MGMLSVATDVLKNRAGILGRPGFVTYFVTYRCNHKCVFCDVWKRDRAGRGEMTLDEIRRAFSTFGRVEVLRISGGEPFLRAGLDEVVNLLDEMLSPGTIHFTTNGFLTDKILKDVSRMKPKHKIHIKVSIDNVGERYDEVRGIEGAYEKALATVKGLGEMGAKEGFHVGINQAIVEEKDIPSYAALRDLVAPWGVTVYPVIAHQSETSLYDDGPLVMAEDVSFKPINTFSKQALIDFIRQVIADGEKNGDFKEKLINNYHWKGLYNRLVHGRPSPNPPCVAVKNHIRVLPNGDVPTCLFNKTVVGNLLDNSLDEIWRGEKAEKARKWVAGCSGCWQSCETSVSAIYTGDIVKGLSFKMNEP